MKNTDKVDVKIADADEKKPQDNAAACADTSKDKEASKATDENKNGDDGRLRPSGSFAGSSSERLDAIVRRMSMTAPPPPPPPPLIKDASEKFIDLCWYIVVSAAYLTISLVMLFAYN